MRDAMAIYKPNKASRSWYVRFYDRTHTRRRVRAFASKRDSEIMERHIFRPIGAFKPDDNAS